MKRISSLLLGAVLSLGLCGMAAAAEKTVKLTCCQEAAAKKEECKHRCCINAHKEGKSCVKCNPNKEDLKIIKDPKPPKK
jgi:hypothetical protein